MPGYKAIGQVGLGGFLYVAAAKLISKVSNYVETGAPVPERPARYTAGVSAPLPSWSSSETVLLTPSIPHNVTATINPPSTLSPSWTMILSFWSTLQTIIHFLTEQCGELIAELAVQLLFVVAMAYLGNYVDQGLMKALGHPKPTTIDDRIDEEAPANSSSMWITLRATIHELHSLADKIQDRINNLEAAMAYIIDGATQAIKDLCTELRHAKKTIASLEGDLNNMTTARNQLFEQASSYLADSKHRILEWEAEREEMSTKHDDAMKDSQTKLKEAGEKFDRLEKKLSEAADKIAELEAHLQRMDKDRGQPTSDEHTETEDKKRILKLENQCKYWQKLLEQNKADNIEKVKKALGTAKANEDKAAERRQEIADVRAVAEIKQLKVALERKEEEFTLAKNQSADEIAALKEALAKKKKEDDEPASSFNPVATVFTPSPTISSHSTLRSNPQTPIPAAPFSPSPSAASFSPSPSPNPTTSYPHTPVEKEPMSEVARRNLDEINRKLAEERNRKFTGKPAKDAEAKPLSGEELGKYM